jgi:zinc/manganese transport system substrate-binding protein
MRILALLITLLCAGVAQAKLNVVATTPDIGALAHEIGGDKITLSVLARPTEDPHFVDAKPSFVIKLNHADALVEGGAELEVGWLPALLDGARNPKIAAGAPGHINCAPGIEFLEVPTSLDRSKGDLHAMGNPHYLTDPVNARLVIKTIAEGLIKLDSANAATYQANLASFTSRLDAKIAEWQKTLEPYRGRQFIAYHNTWPYFARRFGLRSELFLEPKPGIPPTPAHLAEVIAKMKSEKIGVIIVEPCQNRKTAETVAADTGAKVLSFAQYPGGVKGTDAGYFQLLDYLTKTLAEALAAQP